MLYGMADAPERLRWYRLTPERFVVALLPLEGLLLLSEHFRWFAFNEHKGRTVLICLATVAAAFVLMFLWFLAALMFRLRFQFSIRSLFVLTVVVAAACSWLATEMKQAREQAETVEWIKKTGGGIIRGYEFEPSPIPMPSGEAWLHKLLGDDLFLDVTAVAFSEGVDARMDYLKESPHLQMLFPGHANVGDAGLEHLQGLTRLEWLHLGGTAIRGPGLEYIAGLTRLRQISLDHTKVSDAGLEFLEGLTGLQSLNLSYTQVSDAGLKHLKGLSQLQDLFLDGTEVSDAGLEHLKGLHKLQTLQLPHSKFTDARVKKLQQALPKCAIEFGAFRRAAGSITWPSAEERAR